MMKAKVFSTTKTRDREAMGEKLTAWLRENDIVPTDYYVVQSSDCEYHCLSIIIFYE